MVTFYLKTASLSYTLLRTVDAGLRSLSAAEATMEAAESMAQRAVTKGFSGILLRISFYQVSNSHVKERM